MNTARLRTPRLTRAALSVALAAPALALLAGPAPVAVADAPTYLPAERAIASTVTFNYVGWAEQSFTVPAGIYSIDVDAIGAPGGTMLGVDATTGGGRAARVQATLAVEPGDVLYVRVGGGGGNGAGGYNGGGNPRSAAGGGGATDLRTCGEPMTGCSPLASRLVVAGGGGGSGRDYSQHVAGGDAGANAPDFTSVRDTAGGGRGASTTAGGAGGTYTSWSANRLADGHAGTYGTGGNAPTNGFAYNGGAGGGGGGLYGGGSGSMGNYYGGGGGGGSSLVPPGGTQTLVDRTVGSQLRISYDAGPVTEVGVDVAGSLVATGADTTTVTATARIADGTLVPGLEMVFASTDAGQSFGPVTDHGDGTYTATLHGSTTTGPATVSATAKGSIGMYDVSGTDSVTTEGYALTVQSVSATMVATGTDSVTVTATASSASGAPLSGLTVAFDSSDDDQTFGSVTDHEDGSYSATLHGSTTAGSATVTASAAGAPSLTTASVATEGYTVTVQPLADPLVATGSDTTQVTAKAESTSGKKLSGLSVSFESPDDPGQRFGTVTDEGDGTYTATLTGSTTADAVPVRPVVDGAGSPTLVPATVTTEGYTVTVAPVPTKLVATGHDSVPLTATARSESGRLLDGLDVSLTSTDLEQTIGAVTDEGDGTYTAVLSGSTNVRSATIAPVVTGAGEPTLVPTSVETEGYSVTVRPIDDPILGTGAASLTVTAVARSASRLPMPGLTVAFRSTDGDQRFGPVADHGDGTYSATLTGSTTAGIAGIRAVVTGAGAPSTPEIDLITDRYDKPAVTAILTPTSTPQAGWYRTPVTVTFTCRGTLPLTAACPAPVTLGTDGAGQTVTRSVTDTFGSSDTTTSAAVNIDATAPVLAVNGARNGATYTKARKLVCRSSDALSGLASCKVTTSKKKVKRKKVTVVTWTAVAVDVAGNQATTTGKYTLKKKAKKGKR